MQSPSLWISTYSFVLREEGAVCSAEQLQNHAERAWRRHFRADPALIARAHATLALAFGSGSIGSVELSRLTDEMGAEPA